MISVPIIIKNKTTTTTGIIITRTDLRVFIDPSVSANEIPRSVNHGQYIAEPSTFNYNLVHEVI